MLLFQVKNSFFKDILMRLAIVLPLFCPSSMVVGVTPPIDIDKIEKELDSDGLDKLAAQIAQDFEKQEIDGIRANNKILWSIPAAFPEDEFDAQVKDLHVNIPFYGKVKLDPSWYKLYKQKLDDIKKNINLEDIEKEEKRLKEELTSNFYHAQGAGFLGNNQYVTPEMKAQFEKNQKEFSEQLKSNDNGLYAALPWLNNIKQYLDGRYLPAIGLYRSDINEIGFLAANLASEYILFKDLKRAKINKIKDFLTTNRDAVIVLLEKLYAAQGDKKAVAAAKKEISNLIAKHCALFRYNPFKKELAVPFIKYLFIQRVLEPLRNDSANYIQGNADHSFGFVKNSKNELVKSAVTPFSIVTIAKTFIAPIQMISRTSQDAVGHMVQGLQFNDKLFSYIKLPGWCYAANEPKAGLPGFFYDQMAGVIGESLVLIMATKIVDNLLHQHVVDSLSEKPEILLDLLITSKKFAAIESPTQEENEKMVAFNEQFEKEIELSVALHKKGVYSWMNAKQATFVRIMTAGFVCFVLPAILINGIPLVKQIIDVYGGR